MKLVIFCALALAGTFLPAIAQDNAPPKDKKKVAVQLTPPPFEGTVSAGVFDAEGKLVRVLLKNADPKTIPSALNGWILSWDGKKGDGSEVPAGKYSIRAVVAGDVKIEGEAWHFNDWIDPEHPENAPVKTEDIGYIPSGGWPVVFQSDASSKVYQVIPSPDKKIYRRAPGFDWNRYAEDGVAWNRYLGVDDKGRPRRNNGLGARGNDLWDFTIPPYGQGKKVGELPHSITRVAYDSQTAVVHTGSLASVVGATVATAYQTVVISDGEKVYGCGNNEDDYKKLAEIPAEIGGKILDLAVGKEGGFWVVVDTGTGVEVRSYDLSGAFIRQLAADPQLPPVARVAVSDDDKTVALISRDATREIVRVLQQTDGTDKTNPANATNVAPGETVSYWKTIFQRQIVQCQNFGIDPASGKLIPQGDLPAATPLDVTLIENPLDPGKKDALKLVAQSADDGVWISTESGLPLLPAITGEKSGRFILLPEKEPNTARVYVLQYGAVAEFKISGLDQFMQISSDDLAWPPGPDQKIDEDEMDLPKNNDDL